VECEHHLHLESYQDCPYLWSPFVWLVWNRSNLPAGHSTRYPWILLVECDVLEIGPKIHCGEEPVETASYLLFGDQLPLVGERLVLSWQLFRLDGDRGEAMIASATACRKGTQTDSESD